MVCCIVSVVATTKEEEDAKNKCEEEDWDRDSYRRFCTI
jgi:hypothetical protein